MPHESTLCRIVRAMSDLSSLLPASWKPALQHAVDAASFSSLSAFLEAEAEAKRVVFPPREQIFSSLAHTPPDEVKVVIIGQDPYPTAGNANGL